jgi:hypothetical protein
MTAELHGARSQMGKMDVMITAAKNSTHNIGCTEIYKLSCPNTWMYCLECSRTCIPLHKHTRYHPLHPVRHFQHVSQTHLINGLPLQRSPSPISHPVLFTINHTKHCTTPHTLTHNSNTVSFQLIFLNSTPLHRQPPLITASLGQSAVWLQMALPVYLHDRRGTA